MKIAFFEIKPWEKRYIRRKLKGHTLTFEEGPLTEETLASARSAEAISVFIHSQVDKKILSSCKKLRCVVTRSTGFDHIDTKYCKKQGISVCNVPSYGENTVAEHTFALILSLSRNIHRSYVRTRRGNYSIEGLTGFDLRGKTLGIIGGGHIGMHVARMAKGFSMDVLVYDVSPRHFLDEVIGFRYEKLEEILKGSDIVSIHVPYMKATHHLINKDTLAMMREGAILINTSRGGIVDTDALYQALADKKLGGAGLDVIEGEELIYEEKQLLDNEMNPEKWRQIVRDHKIFAMDNVVFTPHNAFNSKEALDRILDTTVQNIKGFARKDPENLVG
ncbi:MAG: NAD(P)-dependent oxidoreductase [Nanoarchaeota archaeon]